MKNAIVETKVKGSLIDRLRFLEQHVLEVISTITLIIYFSIFVEKTRMFSSFGI